MFKNIRWAEEGTGLGCILKADYIAFRDDIYDEFGITDNEHYIFIYYTVLYILYTKKKKDWK